jgi:catalase
LETTPSVLYDAVVIPDGVEAADALGMEGHALEFIKEQYRHCKPILVLGSGADLLAKAQIPETLPNGEADRGLLRYDADNIAKATAAFAAAIGKHRNFERQTDPPLV